MRQLNRFHPLNISLPTPDDLAYTASGLPPVIGDVRFPKEFHLTGLAAHYRVTGDYPDTGGGTFTVGEATRVAVLDYTWKALDTKLNREFTSTWAPASLLCPGDSGPFFLGAADSVFSANTLVRMWIRVQRMSTFDPDDVPIYGVKNVTRHSLHIVFHGYEEIPETEEATP